MSNSYTPYDLYFAYKSVMVNYRMRQDEKRKKLAIQVADRLLGITRCVNCGNITEDKSSICDDCIPF